MIEQHDNIKRPGPDGADDMEKPTIQENSQSRMNSVFILKAVVCQPPGTSSVQ